MEPDASDDDAAAAAVVLDATSDLKSPGKSGGAESWSRFRVVVLCIFVASSGFFHGYDNGVVSDIFTMPSFRSMMGWPEEDDSRAAWEKGITVNGFNIGAAISAVLAGHLIVDRYGRKPALIAGSWLFALGGLVQCAAAQNVSLIVGRLVAGVGVGITSSAGPAYIAEVSPSGIRGTMVGVYQNNVCIAIAASALLNYVDHDWKTGWRLSLGVQVILGALVGLGLLVCCETPRFLQSSGRTEEALKVLTVLRGGKEAIARDELALVQAEIDEEREAGSATWSEVVTNPFFRNVVILGCFVQFFQIITGINAIVSFGGTLFRHLGLRGLVSSVAPAVFFLLGNTIGGFFLVDRLGRRPLLIGGMVAMATTLIVGGGITLGCAYVDENGKERLHDGPGYVAISMVVLYMFSFGISWGFGAWLYCSEIMPLRVRGKAVGLCTATNWGPANVASAFITPVMISGKFGPGGTLLFFGIISAIAIPFAAFCLPETKGRCLEEITPMFRFASCRDFRHFVRGNLRSGDGMGAEEVTDTDGDTSESVGNVYSEEERC